MECVALLDANVVISMLMAGERRSSLMNLIVELAISGAFIPVLTVSTRLEVLNVVKRNPKIRSRATDEEIDDLFTVLGIGVGRCLPPRDPVPRICRDPRDDYLLEEARVCGATHLVTGDRDLLVLDGQFPVRILTPREFAETLGIDPGE